MKRKISFSVIIRITLWIILLIGGAFFSIKNDLHQHEDIFSNIYFHVISFVIGFFILKLSFHAAAIGGRELKKHGKKGDIPKLETNSLVTSGIYSCTRHPMLFGLTLLPLALALLLGSYTFITIVAPLEMIFIILMVIIFEEAECQKKFGKQYDKYRQTTPIFPKTKNCFKKLFL